ncbi:hypothetical protein B0H17DRAFT_914936, partial [Mycena rosella]
MSNTAIVDDRDLLVQYTGVWEDGGLPSEYQGSTRWSATQGSTASLTFDGTKSISYYGNAAPGGPPTNASLVIDGGPPVFIVPDPATVMTANNLFFRSNDLSYGNHTLVVTAENDNAMGVDYFIVNPSPST